MSKGGANTMDMNEPFYVRRKPDPIPFRKFLYNREKGTVMGRNATSWGKLISSLQLLLSTVVIIAKDALKPFCVICNTYTSSQAHFNKKKMWLLDEALSPSQYCVSYIQVWCFVVYFSIIPRAAMSNDSHKYIQQKCSIFIFHVYFSKP